MEDIRIFRKDSEVVKSTTLPKTAVNEELVNRNRETVIIGNPPFAGLMKSSNWKYGLHFFGVHFYVSNRRLKVRTQNSIRFIGRLGKQIKKTKERIYDTQNGCCHECGKHLPYKSLEGHHVLPWSRFPELRTSEDNIILLCRHCHCEIHCNPWKNIEMMKAKAKELGIDLSERYNTT